MGSFDRKEFFPEPLRGEFLENGRKLLLTEDFTYRDEEENQLIEVPQGFLSDFNSVPRGLWNIFPPWQYPEAGIVHDWLYHYPEGRDRGQCDRVHRRILHILGCPNVVRWAAYSALRLGASASWGRHRARDPKPE